MSSPIRAEDLKGLRARSLAGKHDAAFFDIDGTLSKGHMIADFPAHLASAGVFRKKEEREVLECMSAFRKGRITYRKVAVELPVIYARGLTGQKVADVRREAVRFVEARMKSVFRYSKPLISLMKRAGRAAIGLSGSPVEPVLVLARRLGMDAAFGTVAGVNDGAYTGKVRHNLIMLETKERFFRKVVSELKLERGRCFGFGDTEQDVSFLGKVGHPVTLNPSTELRAIALRNGWPIFTLQDDVVGEVNRLLRDADAAPR